MNRNSYVGMSNGCAFCPAMKEHISLQAVCGLYKMGILDFEEWKRAVNKLGVAGIFDEDDDDSVTVPDVEKKK